MVGGSGYVVGKSKGTGSPLNGSPFSEKNLTSAFVSVQRVHALKRSAVLVCKISSRSEAASGRK